jgi:hypothetical protein
MRPVSATLALICACFLVSCAGERLSPSPPQGINLSGEWNFDPNLSDDPSKPVKPDSTPQSTPGGHHGHSGGGRGGGGGGMGMPPGGPGGGGYNFLLVAQTTKGPRAAAAPAHLSITQQGSHLIFRTNMSDGTQTVDDYVAGTTSKIPYADDSTAKRTVGWSGPVFVVTTDGGSKIGWREDQFAVDEDGRLIMTTTTKGGRMGNGEIKRVYDRARGAAAT